MVILILLTCYSALSQIQLDSQLTNTNGELKLTSESKYYALEVSNDFGKLNSLPVIYKEDGDWSSKEPTNLDRVQFAFDFPELMKKDYVKLTITSNQKLELNGMKLRYLEDTIYRKFDYFYFPEYKWRQLDLEDLWQKNPHATFNFVKVNDYTYWLEIWNATDFDPTVSDIYTADLGGTHNGTEWVSASNTIQLAKDARAIFKMDSSGSPTVDDSLYSNNGTVNSATHNAGCVLGGCYDFDGINDYIDAGTDSDLALCDSNVTMTAWVYLKSYTYTNNIIVAKGKSGSYWDYAMFVRSDQSIRALASTGTVTFSTNLPLNEWHHVAVVYESQGDIGSAPNYDNWTFKLYLDGQIQDERADLAHYSRACGENFYIGNGEGLTSYWNGSIDQVMVFPRVLSGDEISSIYNGANNITTYTPQYRENGTYTSNVFNGTTATVWKNITVNGTFNTTQTLDAYFSTSIDNSTWSSWYYSGVLTSGTALALNSSIPYGQYGRYQLRMTTAPFTLVPSSTSVSVDYESYPEVSLEAPVNNTANESGDFTLKYNVSDVYGSVNNCSLYINDVLNLTNSSITEGVSQNFTQSFSDGYYNWSVNCYDDTDNLGESGYFYLNISTTPEAPPVNLTTSDIGFIIPNNSTIPVVVLS